MDPAKLSTSLTELVKKFVISFCEVNVGYQDRLDVFGSIHVRSDDCDVVAFVLNEHCYKNSCEVGEDDEEHASAGIRRQESNPVGVPIKSEVGDLEGFPICVKSEVGLPVTAGSDIIDIYSDVEEEQEATEGVMEDVDQSFIDQLLEMQNSSNQTSNKQNSNKTATFRRRRGQNRPGFSQKRQQQNDSNYFQEPEDCKPEIDFQFQEGFSNAEVDYGPIGEVGSEPKFGGMYGGVASSGTLRKQKKRNVSSNATSSLQGSYFQFESTYTCTACGCRFKSMDGLKCHVNSKHLQQKLYSCHFCSQTFLTRQASYSHRVKFHNISRPKAPLPVNGEFS